MPTVLLTNDDGPPSLESPYIFRFYQYLKDQLGWEIKVVLPSTQKSWIGKAFFIKDLTQGSYYYPRFPDGQGENSPVPRPLKDGELDEWILLDSTPATCVNIALHNLFPGTIDLVISGPNYGRNTSSAFALSSGTLGAALSSSLSKVRAIAISYATVIHPTPSTFFDPAHQMSIQILSYLWDNWAQDSQGGLRNSEVDLYSINVPLIERLLTEQGLQVRWTSMWRSGYGRLFKPTDKDQLGFKFAPDLSTLLVPDNLPEHSDAWALRDGHVSVTPLRATFAEAEVPELEDDRILKLKL